MPTGAIFISQPVSAAPDHLHPGEKEPCRNSRSLRPDWADEAAFFHVLISLAYRHRHLSLTHKAADHRIIPNGNTRHHDHASTQPAVASDADGQIVLVCFLTQFRQDRVVCKTGAAFERNACRVRRRLLDRAAISCQLGRKARSHGRLCLCQLRVDLRG